MERYMDFGNNTKKKYQKSSNKNQDDIKKY